MGALGIVPCAMSIVESHSELGGSGHGGGRAGKGDLRVHI